jgi:hypothetical protein
MLEKVAAAGDQVALRLDCSLYDSFEPPAELRPQFLARWPRQALRCEGAVQVQVSEMKQAKSHRTPELSDPKVGARRL